MTNIKNLLPYIYFLHYSFIIAYKRRHPQFSKKKHLTVLAKNILQVWQKHLGEF